MFGTYARNVIAGQGRYLPDRTPNNKSKSETTKKKVCNHNMQPMYNSHNDSFAGMRCRKCGFTEWSRMDDAYKDLYVKISKEKYKLLVEERDKLLNENNYLRDELRKQEQRLSDARWRMYPDRMGR